MATDGRESPGLTEGTSKKTDPVPSPDEEGRIPAKPMALPLHGGGRTEDPATLYLREIRNWMRFIGIIVVINVVAAVIIGIVVGVEVSHAVNNNITPNSNCLSQGGTDPSC